MNKLSKQQAIARHIKKDDYISCSVAFIDCKKPGSHLKENYSIIGPGVTSSSEQVINLPEPHGFNIGAAAMPNGITNSLHIHFTAEVFIVQKGEWTFRWGPEGENTLVGREGDILSVPSWIFRGFTNTGPDDGWLFTVLGGDNTGGVIFHPEIITEAADYGLYLSKNNTLIDTNNGDEIPELSETIPPMSAEEMAKLRSITPAEMLQRVVASVDRDFQPAFIDGGGAEIAPVIGYGMTQNREHKAPITNPHNFSIEWLRLQKGQSVNAFTLTEKMVLIMRKGAMQISLNDGGTIIIDLKSWEVYSIPAGVVRAIKFIGTETAEALVVISGDHRKRPTFGSDTVSSARSNGVALDASDFIAPESLLPNYTRGQ